MLSSAQRPVAASADVLRLNSQSPSDLDQTLHVSAEQAAGGEAGIVLDLTMPGADGFAVVERLRGRADGRALKRTA